MRSLREETHLQFSILDRSQQLDSAKKEMYDLVIIGGGITGAGIALDAISRGLKVCLIEKNDFASGTSNKSTKLVHGGLRYLKQFEIALVKESGRERAKVHKLAPHLVVPEKMLLPLIQGGTYGKLMTSLGLVVYDFLANVEGEDKRKMLSINETLSKEPLLNKEGLLGGGYYAEYRTDDARLTIELIKKAASFGANCLNYCEMTSFNYDNDKKVESLQCFDHNEDRSFAIRSHKFISAAGPWVDVLRKKDYSIDEKYLHLTKGVHLVFSRERFPLEQSIYFDVPDGRMIFAIPRGRTVYVGTTDTDYVGDLDRVVATKEDALYLLKAVNNMFPDICLTQEDIESNWAGLRPLIHEEGKDPSELSRKDEIFISETGLISIAGGKLTGYRKMAQRAVDAVTDAMDSEMRSRFSKSKTEKIRLTSNPLLDTGEVNLYEELIINKLKDLGISDPYFGWYVTSTYGRQSDIIIDKMSFFTKNSQLEKLIRAELWYSVHYEMTNGLADFFVRRTGRLYFNIKSVRDYRKMVEEDFVYYFNWDTKRIEKENILLDELLQDATTYY
ncbi:glycerol-3-phosphate dehydrogenase/oxidase [Aquimarina pacifica]|uniref:glycerol-3-phosphate dehydrogenase/oxidase n=1 Tax=Aquimarina pacifica TaxID=1296415 RepID=UPI0004704089|nr:glycerol-3-phosphate dehydrogenase/oxidase [Aquimarina pacifica]